MVTTGLATFQEYHIIDPLRLNSHKKSSIGFKKEETSFQAKKKEKTNNSSKHVSCLWGHRIRETARAVVVVVVVCPTLFLKYSSPLFCGRWFASLRWIPNFWWNVQELPQKRDHAWLGSHSFKAQSSKLKTQQLCLQKFLSLKKIFIQIQPPRLHMSELIHCTTCSHIILIKMIPQKRFNKSVKRPSNSHWVLYRGLLLSRWSLHPHTGLYSCTLGFLV